MDHGTKVKGLAEQDSLVEKGHRVRISLKAALPGTQQEVAARQMYVPGSLSQGHVPLIMQHLLLSCYWHHSPMTRIKVRI